MKRVDAEFHAAWRAIPFDPADLARIAENVKRRARVPVAIIPEARAQ